MYPSPGAPDSHGQIRDAWVSIKLKVKAAPRSGREPCSDSPDARHDQQPERAAV